VGQGARRPCYSRQNRERAPWWRGSTLIPRSEDAFWKLAESVAGFQKLFQKRLGSFFEALKTLTQQAINLNSPQSFGRVDRDKWPEAVDANCKIVVCSGRKDFHKPYALATLHRLGRRGEGQYDRFLCGGVQGGAVPSPVWIADLDDYQVVAVFGATVDPRRKYLDELKRGADDFQVIWPLR
jgi:CRISPR-associated protein Cmr6